jgi:sirohydrochlorin cobaltochelatase
LFAVFTVLTGTLLSCVSGGTVKAEAEKPAVVIAAFGSSYEQGQKNLEDFDAAVRKAFPGTDVYWAFTATFIVNKLRDEGKETVFERKVPVRTVEEVYDRLRAEGRRDVLVQCLLIMPGSEYRQVLDTPTDGLNVKYGHALLYYPENIQNTVGALSSDFGDPSDTFTILCAHGNEKHLEYNAPLVEMDTYLQENYRNVRLAVMEGTPAFEPVKEEALASGAEKVQFITLMLTYGDHMSNDVMGDEEDSMKSRLGLPAEVTDGLAGRPAFQKLIIDEMKLVMDQFM